MSQKVYDLSDRNNMFYWQTNRKISTEEQKDIFLDRHRSVKKDEAKAAIEYGMVQAGKSKKDSEVVDLSDPIKAGSVNSVLKARLSDDTQIVIRMHPYFVKNGYFWAESVATTEAKKMGVATYSTYFIDDSQEKFDFDFMIMEALPGKTMQEFSGSDEDLDKRLVEETGKYVAMIHKVKPRSFGFFFNKVAKEEKKLQGQYQSFKQHIFAALEEDLKFLVDHEVFSTKQRKSVEGIFDRNEDLMSCESPSLIHNDVADWNQLSDGEKVTGMVDWDECFSGDPVMDFAAWSLFYDDKRLEHFVRGYQEVSNLPENFQEKNHLFRLRYLVSKMHLRKKRAIVLEDSSFLNERIKRGMEVMEDEFKYFGG